MLDSGAMDSRRWQELLESLRRDRRSGATALTRRAAEGLSALARGDEDEIRSGLRALAAVRPPFGSIFRLAQRAAVTWSEGSARGDVLRGVGAGFVEELEAQHRAVVAGAGEILAGAEHVLTISASSLVRDALLVGPAERRLVTCLESRPGGEGGALARELAAAGLRVRLAPDAAAARLVGEADLVLLGGDTLSPRGLIHKVGTLGLALAAREGGVPMYAVLGSLKVLPAPVRDWADDGAVGEDQALAPATWERLFDQTPLELLGGVLTERGRLAAAEAAALGAVERIHPWLVDLLEH